MNADHGKGAITETQTVETVTPHMSESVELLASNEAHKYWLIYAFKTGDSSPYELRVRKVDVNETNPVSSAVTTSIATTSTHNPYTLKASPQHNRIAIANGDSKTVDVFDFDNATGKLSNRRTSSGITSDIAYGLEFSPDGSQVYFAGYTIYNHMVPKLYQYTISESSLNYVSEIQYYTYTGDNGISRGGGLKLGPDGKIYVVLSYDAHVGVVSSPNEATGLSDRYDSIRLHYIPSSYALQFSTGLSRPSHVECNTNNAPVTQPDDTTSCLSSASRTVRVNVLANDADPDGNIIYLTSAQFVSASDTALARVTVDAVDSSVTLIVKPESTISPAGHTFEIVYNVKDAGLPASQCGTGLLQVTMYPTPSYSDIRVRVSPNIGAVNLSKYIDTTDHITDIQWTSTSGLTVQSPSGLISTNVLSSSRIHTMTYTVSSRCVSSRRRKVYLEVLHDNKVHMPKKPVVICYQYAESVNINQLLGIEAKGTWTYPTEIKNYVIESNSPVYGGALVMNGKAIYHDSTISTIPYHGVTAKRVTFTYIPDNSSCLQGQYSIDIILTDDILK
jgi:hypothetical protein